MKSINIALIAICLFGILFISCSRKVVREIKAERAEEATKDALKGWLEEEEATRKRYNVKCDYTERPGVATITKITPRENNSQEMLVLFNFKPTEPAGNEEEYKYANSDRTLFVNDKFPSKEWCEENGVIVNAKFPANRMEVIEGYMTKYCDQFYMVIPQFSK